MYAVIRTVSAALVVMLACTVSALARGPATVEEKEKVIAVSEKLETEPLRSSAKDDRKWALMFVLDVPDLNLKVCTAFLSPVLSSDYAYSKEINLQTIIASAAFVYGHPEQAKDQDAIYLAGLSGSLRTYEAILRKKPKAHFSVLDDLLQKRDKGNLPTYIQEKKTECDK